MFRYACELSLTHSGSLWLFLVVSSSLWFPLALTGSLRLSLALSGSYWISPCLFLALYGSLWLPLWLSLALTATLWHTLALSGSQLLSNFAYTALDRLTGPLLGSHRRCHDDALYPALVYIYHCVDHLQQRTISNMNRPRAYMQKAGDSWDISPQFFLDFPQNFRLRTRNQYCTQAIAWGSTI